MTRFDRLWEAFWTGPGLGLIKAGAVILFALVLYRVVRAAIKRFLVGGAMRPRYLDKRRADTLASALTSLLRYTLYFLVLGTLLPLIGVNISALIAAAGIGGVALAFGAQHLIRDVITGFFLLFEDQLAVGDQVVAAGVTGRVEEAGLRVTRIRDADGRLHIIPNGQIVQVTNLSTPLRAGRVDIPVGPRADLPALERVVTEACRTFTELHPELSEGPHLVGLVPSGPGAGLALRVGFTAGGGLQEQCEIALRRHIFLAVTGAGMHWRTR